MTHVDEENWAIYQFDLLVRELIKSSFSNDTHVILVSPWFTDYEMPISWPTFVSNFINITEIQRLSDIIKLLLKNGVKVELVCLPTSHLGWDEASIREVKEFYLQVEEAGAIINYNTTNHGKITQTSDNVLFSSANITRKGSGLTMTIQNNLGENFARSLEPERYKEKAEWIKKRIKESTQ